MILCMSDPDIDTASLVEILRALSDQLKLLADLNRKLVEAQRESSGLLREFSLAVHKAFAESVKVQIEMGENILKSNAALAQTLDDIAQKLGVPSSTFPPVPPPSKKGGGTIQ